MADTDLVSAGTQLSACNHHRPGTRPTSPTTQSSAFDSDDEEWLEAKDVDMKTGIGQSPQAEKGEARAVSFRPVTPDQDRDNLTDESSREYTPFRFPEHHSRTDA